jgi:hypothetical protein
VAIQSVLDVVLRLFERDKKRSCEITLDAAGKLGFVNPATAAASLVSPEL